MEKYGKLKLIDTFKKKVITEQTYGKFECECGGIVEIRMASVKNGHSRSCGCMSKTASARYARKPINFFDQDNESTYYWAGFLFGDGSIGREGKLVQIGLSNNSGGYEHLQKLSQFIYGIDYVLKYDTQCNFQVSNKDVRDNLRRFGLIPNKTYDGILTIPFDADGWASYKICKYGARRYRYLTIGLYSYLIKNMIIISDYLPIKAYINKKKEQELYELRIHKQADVRKFIGFTSPTNEEVCLECKWSKLWNFVNS